MDIGVQNLINVIANASGTLGLAIFAIWMLNKVWCDRLREEQERGSQTFACLTESNKVIAANTEVLRQNSEVLEELLKKLGDT